MSFWQNFNKQIVGLAPMDGISDAPFRYIVSKYGKTDVMFTEFISVDGLAYGAFKIFDELFYSEAERPVVVQLFGIDPDLFYSGAQIACELGFDGIDLNMGCPAKKVAKRGAGAGLINNPDLAKRLFEATREGVNDWLLGNITLNNKQKRQLERIKLKCTQEFGVKIRTKKERVPVSIKTRIGFDSNIVSDWISKLIALEPDAITLHGRTLKQMYSGIADWNAIDDAAKLVNDYNLSSSKQIKFLGNGDIKSVVDIETKLKNKNIHGLLIGRASLGNPWIFSDYKSFLENKIIPEHSVEEKIKVAIEHAEIHSKMKPAKAFVQVRKHLAWYLKSFPGAPKMRTTLMLAKNVEEVKKIFKNYLDNS